MDNLIQLQQGAKSFGAKVLLEDAAFSINAGEHVGVIGPNGAGKTTLFRILIGDETLDAGQVIRSKSLRLGYLSQHDHWSPGETVEDFIARDTSLPIWELKSIGNGLGIDQAMYERPIESLSGGYRMRAKLLKLIGQEPNLMLLDEPTNYLDLETLLVLEKFLQGFQGAFLLISHDREFLRRTTDHILEIEEASVTKFNGNIDDYFEQKQMLREQLEARALSLQQKRQQILEFVSRFGAKATKASQAQSRLKSLNRMETIELKPLPVSARIRIPAPKRVGKIVLSVKGADFGYGERVILTGVDLQLNGGAHLAVVGLNGAGKSTLLKGLTGRIAPLAGSVEEGYESTFAYFHQHVAENLHPEDTVLRSLQKAAHDEVLPQEILDLAGSLLFSGDDVHKPIRVLSGGERSRVALGQVLLQKASCLLLDEPTNHLDFQTVEALTQALASFEGSVIVVSHDRSFIKRVGTQILEVSGGRTTSYPGSYDDYVWSLERGAYQMGSGKPSEGRSNEGPSTVDALDPAPGQNYKERRKALDRRARQLDNLIASLDEKIASCQTRLGAINADLATESDALEARKKVSEMTETQAQLDRLESEWLEAAEQREAVAQETSTLLGLNKS